MLKYDKEILSLTTGFALWENNIKLLRKKLLGIFAKMCGAMY